MAQSRRQIPLAEITLEQVVPNGPDFIFEASLAFSRKRGDRSFFIREPERLAQTAEELLLKYNNHHKFMNHILDERDRLLDGKAELESIMELLIMAEGETALLPQLVKMKADETPWGQAYVWPDEAELAARLIESWHMILVTYSNHEDDSFQGNSLEQLIQKYQDILEQTDFNDFAHIVQLIMDSENEGEAKIKMIEIHQREDKLFREIAGLLLTLAHEVEKAVESIRPDIEAMSRFTAEVEQWELCRARVASFVQGSFSESVTVYLCPQLMMPNGLNLNYTQSNTVFLIVGIYFFELIEQVDIVQKQFDTIIERSKLLADPSRLKIIMLLQNRPMYLKEMADSLGLSSATLSHHVQNMINHDLLQINMTQSNRRVYYGLRHESFAELGRLIADLGESNHER